MIEPMLIGKGTADTYLLPSMAVRHGLIAGATGTGKTITLKVLCEQFSAIGTPVFVVDVKGDVSSLSAPGTNSDALQKRIDALGLGEFAFYGYPVTLWDVFGKQGIPLRTTVSEMGPLIMARLLGLNDVQSGVMNIAFKVADDQGLLLLDLKDLRAILNELSEHSRDFEAQYGKVNGASVGAILRNLLTLEEQGGSAFFGEPALTLDDLMIQEDGKGMLHILAADQLVQAPALYSSVLIWLLSELYETLPEAGEVEQPKLVLLFDEAHLIFKDAPKVLLDQVEQVVRLIRSKGVGVFFCSQSPLDIPESVLAQMGNHIQHALRAYTPKEQKALKAVAASFRTNPEIDVAESLGALSTGEALVSFLDEKGVPGVVEKISVCPPHSRIGALNNEEKAYLRSASPLAGRYEVAVDRVSAYELLAERAEQEAVAAKNEAQRENEEKERRQAPSGGRKSASKKSPSEEALSKAANTFVSTVSRSIGRELVRGLLGSLKKR